MKILWVNTQTKQCAYMAKHAVETAKELHLESAEVHRDRMAERQIPIDKAEE